MGETHDVIWIEITKTRGSAPRDAGTAMMVTSREIKGTIGGGALEYAAIAKARKILSQNSAEQTETIPLGPNLGQCCGGAVTLRYTFEKRYPDQKPMPAHPLESGLRSPKHLWLWGAGHVGRAMVDTCHPQQFKITWIDSSVERFPALIPAHITQTPAVDMPLLAIRAPTYAHHLIFTYSHDIDLALCAALLKRGAASIGLIGSHTKWARFSKRLAAMGLDPAPITCPIGDKTLGKTPHAIAHGTVQQLLAAQHPEACS